MKKSIIFFSNKDEIFTLPIILFLIKNLNSKFNIYLKLEKTSKKKDEIIKIDDVHLNLPPEVIYARDYQYSLFDY